eukprot:14270412-Alexandrium_andersonii.AAC.1
MAPERSGSSRRAPDGFGEPVAVREFWGGMERAWEWLRRAPQGSGWFHRANPGEPSAGLQG